MGRLFGTDGVRGIANEDLTNELAMKIGSAAATVLLEESKSAKPTVLIGKDTRASGDMLEAALTAGLCSVGCNVLSVGVVPTPAVAYLVGQYQCEAGIMISASHNPCEYNGIKIFQKQAISSTIQLKMRLNKSFSTIQESRALKSAAMSAIGFSAKPQLTIILSMLFQQQMSDLTA